jgi:Xaa-Pro aminopeptidase
MKIRSEEYLQRIKRLQETLRSESIDRLILSEEEDIYYLTGLTYKSLERLFLLLVGPEELVFILPKMELAHLKHVQHVSRIEVYWEYPAPEGQRWQDVLMQELKNIKDLALSSKSPFEIADFLISESFNVKRSSALERLRWIKSNEEVQLIRNAAHYCNQAIQSLHQKAYYGMSELEVFAIGKDIQRALIRETDFDYLSSDVLVAAWPGRISDQPHGVPEVGDLLIGGSHISLAFLRVNGYAAELERTFFTQTASAEYRELFEIMINARKLCYDKLRAGVIAEEIDQTSREFFAAQGLADKVMHRTGHGIGLGNHEGPCLAMGDKTVLEENMVVSIEPGIYVEGVGGFRHSDTVRVLKDGFEILTEAPDLIKDLQFTQRRPLQRLKGQVIRKMFGIKS